MLKYSFIIPVYNKKEYLEECVESILALERYNLEIILVDDGSTDGSSVLCDSLQDSSRQIRVFHQENRGVSAARNKGIEIAEGKFISFIDGDDTLDKEKTLAFMSEIEDLEAFDLAVSGMAFEYHRDGRVYRRDELVYPKKELLEPEVWHEEFGRLFEKNQISSSCSKVFKRCILIDNGIRFNESMIVYEDLDFVIRYMACCKNIYMSDLPVYKYRQAEDEGSASRRLGRVQDLTSLIDCIESSLIMLIERQGMDESPKEILLPLYLSAAGEKINVSSRRQITEICDSFGKWYKAHCSGQKTEGPHLRYLLNKQVNRIILRRTYAKIRHRVAVAVKSALY